MFGREAKTWQGRDLGDNDQITRAAFSIPSNIAEGMERGTTREKVPHLCIAKASCGELRTQIIIGGEIGYLPQPLSNEWITETRELSRMLSGLINKISD
ncbi:four helix bundle protein [Pseudomonas sp. JUb96]|nr:four helix bundle protein [Pseudomonas sp. JUb96]